jgi:hypothetical protein
MVGTVFSTQLVNCCPRGRRNYNCVLLPLYLLSVFKVSSSMCTINKAVVSLGLQVAGFFFSEVELGYYKVLDVECNRRGASFYR